MASEEEKDAPRVHGGRIVGTTMEESDELGHGGGGDGGGAEG